MEFNKIKKIFSSSWILLSLLMFLNGLGLIYAGSRAKHKIWKAFGLAYIILAWVFMSLDLVEFYIISWGVSIIHTIYIRKEYFIRMKVLDDCKEILSTKKAEQDKKLANKVYKEILGEDIQNYNNKVKKENIEENKVKRREFEKNEIYQIDKLDINTCSDAELSQVPGVGIILSKKVMDIRKAQKQFTSLDEFYEALNISYEKREKLNKWLECGKPIKVEKDKNDESYEMMNEEKNRNKNVGRKIDF